MAKYRIMVEEIPEAGEARDEEFAEKFSKGIECDGFTFMAHKKDSFDVGIHNMNVDGISDGMKNSTQLMMAAVLAKAKRDVVEIGRNGEKNDFLKHLLNGLR